MALIAIAQNTDVWVASLRDKLWREVYELAVHFYQGDRSVIETMIDVITQDGFHISSRFRVRC
ncbi:MAG: hypothetical protein N2235_24925 [Fischerella sp.]|nr:hypothetical protein [Fischerella sp.]